MVNRLRPPGLGLHAVARRSWWYGPGLRRVRLLYPLLLALLIFAPLIAGGLLFRQDDCSRVGCALPLSFGAPLYVIALGYVAFFVVGRTLPLARYLSKMRTEPARFLEGQFDQASWSQVIPRVEFYEAVAVELRAGQGRAQFITGPPGSGKTTSLLGLAAWLAEHGAVPVLISVASVEAPINLPALAKARFARILDATDAQGERLWRQLCRARRAVILADGLDEATLGASELDPRQLRDELRVGRWPPVVFSTRPAAVPSVDRAPPFRLGELRKDAVAHNLADRVRAESGVPMSSSDAEALTTALGIPGEPFYLGLVVAVIASAPPRSADQLVQRLKNKDLQQARNLLLDEYLDALADRRILQEVPIDVPRRHAALDEAGEIALYTLREEVIAAPLEELLHRPEPLGGEPRRLQRAERVEYACRLGITRLTRGAHERELRFNHRIVRACLAARTMRRAADASSAERLPARTRAHPCSRYELLRARLAAIAGHGDADASSIAGAVDDAWREFLAHNIREESFLAARMLTLDRPQLADQIVSFLLERGERVSEPPYRLLYATAAANIVADNGLDAVEEVCRAVRKGWAGGARSSCFAAVRALAALDHEQSYKLMWEFVEEADYSLTWELVEALTGATGARAWEALAEEARRALDACQLRSRTVEEPTMLAELSIVAKILPSLAAKSRSSEVDETLERLLHAVREMSRIGRGLGIEASLAQGFKQAAGARDTTLEDRAFDKVAQIASFLDSARFWYSRVTALQALVLIEHQPEQLTVARAAIHARRKDAHPLVRAAASLAQEALNVKRSERERYVWHDESVDVARSGVELHPRASQLLADVVLILNMNEQRWSLTSDRTAGQYVAQPEEGRAALVKQQQAVGTLEVLPACLRADRHLVLGKRPDNCLPGCSFHLCPYSSPEQRKTGQALLGHAHRGDPSPAFCLHQRSLLLSHRVPAWLRWHPRPLKKASPEHLWNPLRRRALRNFWAEMQARGESTGLDAPEA